VDRHKILKNIKIYFVKVQKIGQGIVEGKKFAQIQKSLAQNAKSRPINSRGTCVCEYLVKPEKNFVQNAKKLDK
jgi:hypothetical protein